MGNWFKYKNGDRIGGVGIEGGVTLRDEEHRADAWLKIKHCSKRIFCRQARTISKCGRR